jgi:hypothetical protein
MPLFVEDRSGKWSTTIGNIQRNEIQDGFHSLLDRWPGAIQFHRRPEPVGQRN